MHPTWICYITDAVDSSILNSVYTKTETDGLLATMLNTIYPVGSIYIGTQATCPMSALISGSTWELVSAGRTLQGADNSHAAGSTIEAGLPNITSDFIFKGRDSSYPESGSASGAISLVTDRKLASQLELYDSYTPSGSSFVSYIKSAQLNANNSSSIYGNSTTVQPPAYIVNIWRRTA